MLVRKARCPGCGALKATKSPTAWIYCDYCGQLMDFDHEKLRGLAVTTGEAYEKLQKQLGPRIARARNAGDRAELMACHRQLQAQYVEDCRAMYLPRIADPVYRAALVEYLAHVEVVRDLDPRMPGIVELVNNANAGFEFDQVGDRYLVRPSTLWPIVEANREATRILRDAISSAPGAVPDPDNTPDDVANRVAVAFQVHAWLSMIDDKAGVELLARTGLAAGYEHIPDPELRAATCTKCGQAREVPVGAQRAVCEGCGHVSQLGVPVSCAGCGATIVLGHGQSEATCSHCKAEVRLIPEMT
jgi:hypothetical protein